MAFVPFKSAPLALTNSPGHISRRIRIVRHFLGLLMKPFSSTSAKSVRKSYLTNWQRLCRTTVLGTDDYTRSVLTTAGELWFEWWSATQDSALLRGISSEPRIRDPQVSTRVEDATLHQIDLKLEAKRYRQLMEVHAKLLDLVIVQDRKVPDVAVAIFGSDDKRSMERVRDRVGVALTQIAGIKRLWGT